MNKGCLKPMDEKVLSLNENEEVEAIFINQDKTKVNFCLQANN